ncbi:MAG: type II secretion system F family protein, partial [Thiotrichaceae bacterium]|nr:type II secretion system F family protein [Thiotrichaceae bacterium]
IAASESGGYLQKILEHLVEMEKQRDELNTSLISAVSYPAFLMVFSVAMVIFILVVVFPKFADMFVAIQDQLPATTIYLMAASHIIIEYWWALLIGFVALIMGVVALFKSELGSRKVASFKLKAPGIKHIFIKIYLIQIMRVLGLSLKHGVNLLEALEIAKDVANNYIFHKFVDELIDNINDGKKLALGFNESEFIPPMVKQMITTGEETGNLALVSTRIADYFQKELEKLLKFITKAIEPIMLIVMGVVVRVLVSSLILPIFKLSHAVH